MPLDRAGELGHFDRLGPAAVVQVEHDHRVLLADLKLLAFVLHVAGAQMGVNIDRHFAGGHFAPHAVNLHAVRAGKALRANIHFARTVVGLAFDGVRVAELDAAASGSRLGDRADRARRLFDRDINIGFARPRNADDAIADNRFLQFLQKRFALSIVAFAGQSFERGLGDARSGQFDLRHVRRPSLAENADSRPADAGDVVDLLGRTQAKRVRFAA